MHRRDLIAGLGGAVAWPFAACAQQQAMPVIGFLGTASADEYAHYMPGFRRGLSKTGFVEGENVALAYRFAENHVDQLPALAAELIDHRVAAIFATGGAAPLFAARTATATIPIIFANGADPMDLVERGLISSLNSPGGNITGASFLSTALDEKRLALLHELVPQASLIAVLIDQDDPSAKTQTRQLQETARRLGIQLQFLTVSGGHDFDAALAEISHRHASALFVAGSGSFTSRRDQLVPLVARIAVPASYSYREFTAAGGLMSYGASITDGFRQAGVYTGLVLKGTKPGDLPVVQPTKFELVINLKTAKALGLTIPPSILADEVIEQPPMSAWGQWAT